MQGLVLTSWKFPNKPGIISLLHRLKARKEICKSCLSTAASHSMWIRSPHLYMRPRPSSAEHQHSAHYRAAPGTKLLCLVLVGSEHTADAQKNSLTACWSGPPLKSSQVWLNGEVTISGSVQANRSCSWSSLKEGAPLMSRAATHPPWSDCPGP